MLRPGTVITINWNGRLFDVHECPLGARANEYLHVSFATRLAQQYSVFDADFVRHGFGHIVNGQSSNGSTGEGFHFDAGRVVRSTFAMNDGNGIAVQTNVHIDRIQWEWVAEWDQFAGPPAFLVIQDLNSDVRYACFDTVANHHSKALAFRAGRSGPHLLGGHNAGNLGGGKDGSFRSDQVGSLDLESLHYFGWENHPRLRHRRPVRHGLGPDIVHPN